jgi:hypothetical protein
MRHLTRTRVPVILYRFGVFQIGEYEKRLTGNTPSVTVQTPLPKYLDGLRNEAHQNSASQRGLNGYRRRVRLTGRDQVNVTAKANKEGTNAP